MTGKVSWGSGHYTRLRSFLLLPLAIILATVYYSECVYHESVKNDGSNGGMEINHWRQIKFTSPNEERKAVGSEARWWFDSGLSFSARGMDHLYILDEYLMKWLQPPGLPSGFIREKLFDEPMVALKQSKNRLISHFWGMILATTGALVLALVIPLLGFLICCCWCSSSAKRSEEGSSPYQDSPRTERKRRRNRYKVDTGCDPCCRSLFGAHLFIFLLLITLFVICAFVTNEYMENGLRDLPKTVNKSLDDMEMYLNATQVEVNVLLKTNFEQLEDKLGESLDRSGVIVKNRLGKVSHAVALDNLTEIVSNLENINNDLGRLAQETNELKSSIHMLQKGLKSARNNLVDVFRNCSHPICGKLKRKYRSLMSKLSVATTLGHLPNLFPLMDNITKLLNENIISEVKRGKLSFDRISIKIQVAVNDTIPNIKKQIRLVKKELARTADDINEALKLPFTDIRNGKHGVYLGSRYIKEYELYRYYAFLGSTMGVLVILFLYMFGLLRGICESRPTAQEYRNRRFKPKSSWPFKLGIILFFLLFGVLFIFTTGLFIGGGLMDRVGCYYLEHPSDKQVVNLVGILQSRSFVGEKEGLETMNMISGEKANIAQILYRCHQNMSIYRALQLYKHNRIQLSESRQFEGFNITDFLGFKERYQIEKKMDRLIEKAYPVNPGPISLLSLEGMELIRRLSDTSLGTLNFSQFADLIHQHITPIDLAKVSKELNEEANQLPPSQIEHASTLKNIALMLEGYQDKVVSKIKSHVVRLKEGAEEIEEKAQYGKKGLKEALSELMSEAKYAQHFLEHRGMREIKMAARGFVNDLVQLIDVYAKHVVDQVDGNIGKCEPVSRAVNATTMAVCNEIVMPLNGYWLSMASALVICLPATFCAAVLSKLYRKLKARKESRKNLHDSDLNLDDDDDIPLQENISGHKETSSSAPHGAHLRYSSGLYPDSSGAPSAPHPGSDDNWSPGAPPPHLYIRPPPYNFH